MYLNRLRLQNFMGFKDSTFEFMDNDKILPICLLFAPNGSGKTTILKALDLVYNSPRILRDTKSRSEKDIISFFKKFVHNPNYDMYASLKKTPDLDMRVEADFLDNGVVKKVIITNSGVQLTELDHCDYCYVVDSDNPNHLNKFQFKHNKYVKDFLSVANYVYNFPTKFDKKIIENTENSFFDNLQISVLNEKPEEENFDNVFYTDLIIEKYGVSTHYKQMSGGEKKIACLLSQIFDDTIMDKANLIVIDSFEKEIYYTRQSKTIDMMLNVFPNKQFIIVTHSQTLINHVKDIYGEKCLYDIESWKKKELGVENYAN